MEGAGEGGGKSWQGVKGSRRREWIEGGGRREKGEGAAAESERGWKNGVD